MCLLLNLAWQSMVFNMNIVLHCKARKLFWTEKKGHLNPKWPIGWKGLKLNSFILNKQFQMQYQLIQLELWKIFRKVSTTIGTKLFDDRWNNFHFLIIILLSSIFFSTHTITNNFLNKYDHIINFFNMKDVIIDIFSFICSIKSRHS